MAGDINYKSKCFEIAEWIGSVYHADDDAVYGSVYSNWFTDGALMWPDLTKDEAGLWCLTRHLLEEDYHVDLVTYQERPNCNVCDIRDSWTGKALASSKRPKPADKALIEATCNLIKAIRDDE